MNGRQSTLWAWGWTHVPYQGVQMSSIQGTLQRAGCVNLDPAWRTPTRWMPYVLQGVIVNLGDLNASSVLVHNHPQSWLADGSHLPNTSSSLAINPCRKNALLRGCLALSTKTITTRHQGLFAGRECLFWSFLLYQLPSIQNLLVLSREWMGLGEWGMIIDSYCGSFPHSLLSTSKKTQVSQFKDCIPVWYHPFADWIPQIYCCTNPFHPICSMPFCCLSSSSLT